MTYDPSYTRIGLPRPTPAVGRLMLVNAAVFVVNMALGGRLSERPEIGAGGAWFCVSWERLWDGYGLGLYRLLTYQFTHSFSSPLHLLWNMIGLYFFGGIAEQRIGYRGTWKLYLAGGLAGALAHMAMYALMRGGDVSVVGASGSCYALFLYAVCAAPRMEVLFFFVRVQLILLGVLFVGLALYDLFLELTRGIGSGVSNGAHLGGAAFGALVWKLDWFRDRQAWTQQASWFGGLRARWRSWRARRADAAAAIDRQQIDRILDKVKEHGLPSLTPEERSVLERASRRARR
jgi:membrane associated rhomboid family serine protease